MSNESYVHYTTTCICNLEYMDKVSCEEQWRKAKKHFNNSESLTNNSVQFWLKFVSNLDHRLHME
jgi:hypothetical protein